MKLTWDGFARATAIAVLAILVVLSSPCLAQAVSSDYNNDGRDDILTLYNYGNANTGLIALTAGVSSFTSSLTWSSGPGNWDWSRAKSVTGDYNADGRDDVLVLYDYGDANTAVIVIESTAAGFLPPRIVWSSGPGNWDWNRAKPAAGDFNADGRDDILVLYDYGGLNTGAIVFASNGATFAPQVVWSSGQGNWDWSRAKQAGGDYNADSRGDILVMYDYGGANTGAIAFASTGVTFTPQVVWSSGPGNMELGRTKVGAGDFSGDGRDDIIALYDAGDSATNIKILKSNTIPFTLSEAWSSGPGNWELSRAKINVGDFNNDTFDDVMALYDYGNANTGAIVFASNGSTCAPDLPWSSGSGNWQWKRSNVAAGGALPPGFEPMIYRIGASVNGAELSVIKTGNGTRRFIFIAGHHGDEYQGMNMLDMFGEFLRRNPEVMPENAEVWLIPCLNPDGAAAGTRWNARGVNLNRNYGTDDWGLYGVSMQTILEEAGLVPLTDSSAIITGTPFTFNYPGPYPFSEPETQAVDYICRSTGFSALISLHETEDCVYWGQTGVSLAYTFGNPTGLPVVGQISVSGDTTRWFGQITGNPSITVELSEALAGMDPGAAFNILLPGFLATIAY